MAIIRFVLTLSLSADKAGIKGIYEKKNLHFQYFAQNADTVFIGFNTKSCD